MHTQIWDPNYRTEIETPHRVCAGSWKNFEPLPSTTFGHDSICWHPAAHFAQTFSLVFTSPICILLYLVSTVHLGNLLIVVASSGTLLLDGFRILKIYTVSLTVYVLIFAIQQICQLFPYSIHPQNIINKLASSKHHPISSKQCSKPCVANYIIINQPSFISCIHLICIYPHILTLRISITRT